MNKTTLKTNLNIYVIIIISLTVLNGTAAIFVLSDMALLKVTAR